MGIVVVLDELKKDTKLAMSTTRAYAALHGYDFFVIEAKVVAPQCKGSFSFRKHCAVALWLRKTRPPGYTALVLDSNCVMVSEVSLKRWLNDDADLMFYLHSWKFEIVPNTYIVRNTPLGRLFLRLLASYHKHEPSGFSNGDTGAIHLAMLAAIDGHRSEACRRQYNELRQKADNMWPYYEYVACTRREMGPARKFAVGSKDFHKGQLQADFQDFHTKGNVTFLPSGHITILPRYHGMALDCSRCDARACIQGAIPFSSGEKDPVTARARYQYMFSSPGKTTGWRSPPELLDTCSTESCKLRFGVEDLWSRQKQGQALVDKERNVTAFRRLDLTLPIAE